MNWQEYIKSDNRVLSGKPVFVGTRISVEHIVGLLASGWTEEQILANYPRLSKQSIVALFSYLKELVSDSNFYSGSVKLSS